MKIYEASAIFDGTQKVVLRIKISGYHFPYARLQTLEEFRITANVRAAIRHCATEMMPFLDLLGALYFQDWFVHKIALHF